ncbi:MAG: type-F conjugative transfer system pilin assembly protein TrbC [Burkholderiaceae bacterium]|nr:MAG: type-F conjugative transfer system pilin assembly protein TrbC [Burkholderiaceae bacterium]
MARRRTTRVVLCAAAALVLQSAALGQALPKVTDADIERARQQHPMPTDAELARVPVPSTPLIDALPQPTTRTPVDLEALAKGFDAQADKPVLGAASGPSLLVFVSFAMPEATITRLLDQASRARATLVLRGLVNGSLRDTVERMQRLIGNRQVAVQIDPQAFDRFSIVRTPSFVLVRDGAASKPCAAGMCIASDQFVLAAGDVSLDYVLRFFERSAPGMARDASSYLQRMKGAVR